MNEIDAGINEVLSRMRSLAVQARGGAPVAPPGELKPSDFSSLFRRTIDGVNDMQHQATGLAERFEKGDAGVSLAEVMVAREKAGVAFQAVLQVRNRLVRAYQDVMNMPI